MLCITITLFEVVPIIGVAITAVGVPCCDCKVTTSLAQAVQDMPEGDKYTCPLCVRALQQQERREQRRAEAAAAAEIEREAREAQAARKAKLV